MTKEEHIAQHKKLHASLDELAADYLDHTGGLPSKNTILDLMRWSHEQTTSPVSKSGEEEEK